MVQVDKSVLDQASIEDILELDGLFENALQVISIHGLFFYIRK